jgi:ABC-type bacteriocin/lantibiotic exporter with double-glycine peptidase domain
MAPDKISGHLRVDRVSYHYPGQNTAAVKEVTFLVKQGAFVVVAGGSGSGKSTLGRLLSGLEKPHGGHVFLDDYELHTLDPKVLRGNIAVVPQEFRLINGTLHENIKGSSSATLDDVISAAKAACIWDEIDALPMKLHTLTGTQFGAFSGGQIQRIAIARALIRKPRILIMDEATSALDNKLQEQIITNVKSMNCTVIFIAHRLKIAREADQVFVLDSGQCVERGTHDELLGYGKFYAKMWQAMS